MLWSLIRNIDEKGERRKKEFQTSGIKLCTNRPVDRLAYSVHGAFYYDKAMLIPENTESKEVMLENMHGKSVLSL